MKKTFFYNFFPSKADEEACKSNNTAWLVTRSLVEIRDIHTPPLLDLNNPWIIKKTITHYEAAMGKLMVPYAQVFEHIFRYWTMDMANLVVYGNKVNVTLWDVTEQDKPKRYHNETVYFELLANDDYAIVCMDLFKDKSLGVDDEIGLYWDPRSFTFQFKLIRKVNA